MGLSLDTLTLNKYYQMVKVKIQLRATRIEDAIFRLRVTCTTLLNIFFILQIDTKKYETHECQPLLNIFYMFSANKSISSFHSIRELLENK